MAACQGVVMEEHGSLQLKPLLEEGQGLDFTFFLDQSWAVLGNRRDFVDEPDVRALAEILVTVDFLLFVAQSGSGVVWVHIATLLGLWMSLNWPERLLNS